MTGLEIGATVIGGAYVSWWMRQMIFGGMKRDAIEMQALDKKLATLKPFKIRPNKMSYQDLKQEVMEAGNGKDLSHTRILLEQNMKYLNPKQYTDIRSLISDKMNYMGLSNLKGMLEHIIENLPH